MEVTFDMIRSSPEIRTYITQADASLTALGFTEHSFAHVGKCAHVAAQILTGEADISTMAIEYDPNPVKKYNKSICETLGIAIPEGYTAIE